MKSVYRRDDYLLNPVVPTHVLLHLPVPTLVKDHLDKLHKSERMEVKKKNVKVYLRGGLQHKLTVCAHT